MFTFACTTSRRPEQPVIHRNEGIMSQSPYAIDGGSAFCTFLDAKKAFDRVDYCRLFRELVKRKLPGIYVRLLVNLYTNSIANVSWNVILSENFQVKNGVRQGGIVSPVLFFLYR